MDLDSLKNTVSNLTLYDLKAGFRKAQNGKLWAIYGGSDLVAHTCSGHELYRNGVQGMYAMLIKGSLIDMFLGSRSYEQ